MSRTARATASQKAKAIAPDAVLVMSFGGPEGPDDVVPFLERVTAGRNVPAERLTEVAHQYLRFGGVSPINANNRRLVAAIEAELVSHGIELPVYWGNRNWHPLVTDTVTQMADDGIGRALCFVTSAFGSYSGCRQYADDLSTARQRVGLHAPVLDKLRLYWNHPGHLGPFIEATTELWLRATHRHDSPRLVFTAHSLPISMAATSPYVEQLGTAAGIVAAAVAPNAPFDLVYQSRSGPPQVPWLEPDIGDHLHALAANGTDCAVVVPLGFTSDHQEVVFDLDTQAAAIADDVGIEMYRAPTPGTHTDFVSMVRELVVERLDPSAPRRAWPGTQPAPEVCAPDCCPAPARPTLSRPAATES